MFRFAAHRLRRGVKEVNYAGNYRNRGRGARQKETLSNGPCGDRLPSDFHGPVRRGLSITLTLVSKAAFPYEAEGSQIVVTLPDGTQRVYGSELIGQNYENPKYMFGRVNTGAPSNLSPESDEYQDLLNERIAERKENLRRSDTPIPIKFLPNSSLRAASASIRTFRRQRLNFRPCDPGGEKRG